MNIPLAKLGRGRIAPESAFDTDPGDEAYVDIALVNDGMPEGLPALQRLLVENKALRGHVEGLEALIGVEGAVPENSTIKTLIPLAGYSPTPPASGSDIVAAAHATTGYPLAWVLKTLFGAQYAAGKTTTAAGAQAVDSVLVTSAADLRVGQGIWVKVGTDWRLIVPSERDTGAIPDVLTPRVNLLAAAAGAGGDDVIGTITSYCSPAVFDRTYHFRFYGHKRGSTTPLCAHLCLFPRDLEVQVKKNEETELKVTWLVVSCIWDSASLIGAAPMTWPYPAPTPVAAGRVCYYEEATPANYHTASTKDLTFTFTNGAVLIPGPSGAHGVDGVAPGLPKATVKMRLPMPEDGSLRDYRAAQTRLGLQFEHGGPGRGFAFGIAAARIDPAGYSESPEGDLWYCDVTLNWALREADVGADVPANAGAWFAIG